MIYDRKDLPQIKAIANWIDTHCAEGELSYMIPHDMCTARITSRTAFCPKCPSTISWPSVFSVPGTHNFPHAVL